MSSGGIRRSTIESLQPEPYRWAPPGMRRAGNRWESVRCADWKNIPDLANIGYPIVEAEPDGTFVLTKHKGTGGRVSLDSVKEQLLYELGDPTRYLTPDCTRPDFTSIQLEVRGRRQNRVRVSGIRGGERPPTIKLSISFADGWKAMGTLVYTWPDALEKAGVWPMHHCPPSGCATWASTFGACRRNPHQEFLGVNACHGPVAAPASTILPRCSCGLAPGEHGQASNRPLHARTGSVGIERASRRDRRCGEGRPAVREIVAYWPALLPREEITTRVKVDR